MRRKICVVITARPSYSRIRTALTAICEHPGLELQLVVAASALLKKFGSAIDYIQQDGFKIDAEVQSVVDGENLLASAKTVGLGTLELSSVFERLKPDVVVTIADRFETISTAICAALMNIPLAHIQGGEISGNIDDKIRHAITKLADIHLVSNDEAQQRVIQLGECPQKVYNTGCPSIDIAASICDESLLSFEPDSIYAGVGRKLKPDGEYLVVLQHPVTTEYPESQQQIEITLNVVKRLEVPAFWFWPNADAGSDGAAKAIRSFRETNDKLPIHFLRNLEGADFLRLLRKSACLIGNSSAGIRECAYLGVPVVNIGSRQNGRKRADNVIDVGYNADAIFEAVKNQLKHRHYASSDIYGTGNSGKNVADILANADLTYTKLLTF